MLNHQVNPIDELVDIISKNKHLLNATHMAFFRALVGSSKNAEVSEKSTISDLLAALNKMAISIKSQAEIATDPEAFKSLIGSIEKVMSMVNKYSDQVSQEEKMSALQNSVLETLNEMPEVYRDAFLSKWRGKIADIKG